MRSGGSNLNYFLESLISIFNKNIVPSHDKRPKPALFTPLLGPALLSISRAEPWPQAYFRAFLHHKNVATGDTIFVLFLDVQRGGAGLFVWLQAYLGNATVSPHPLSLYHLGKWHSIPKTFGSKTTSPTFYLDYDGLKLSSRVGGVLDANVSQFYGYDFPKRSPNIRNQSF